MIFLAHVAIALQDLAALEADVSAAAGTSVAIDRRLRLPQCGHPPIVSPVAGTVAVECTGPAWRIFVAAHAALSAAPLVRRGDAVSVTAAGSGFSVTVEGIAEGDAPAGGRLRVRDRTSGARLTAVVTPDGSLVAPGYNAP